MTNLYYWPFEFGKKSKANKELQKRLGFSDIDADGIFGSDTKWVLEAYQTRNNLPVTGVVDRATEDRLFPGNYDRRTPSMNINSNWLSGIVASTGFKYVLTMIATYIAARTGVDQGTLVGILSQVIGVILGLWGMWEASKSKVVVDGVRVEVKNLPAADQAKIVAVVEKAAAAKV
jgi:hypothetical protein